MKRAVVIFGFIALLAPIAADADPIDIQVLNVIYKAAIDIGYPYNLTSDPSSTPMTEMAIDLADAGFPLVYAAATADWLTVAQSSFSAPLGGGIPNAASRAEFELTFRPLTDGIGTVGIDLAPCGTVYMEFCSDDLGTIAGGHTTGFASLFDVTTRQEVWRYTVNHFAGPHISYPAEGIPEGTPAHLPLVLPTAFSAAHVYDLLLVLEGASAADRTANSIQVSGFHQVPEPSSLLLLSAGLAGIGVFRRAPTRKSS